MDIKRIIFYASIIVILSSCKTNFENQPMFCKRGDGDIWFTCNSTYNTFHFDPKYRYTMDKEIVYPIPFSIHLPKGITSFSFISSNNFLFKYNSKQYIYIYIDLFGNKTLKDNFIDTVYKPNQNDLSVFTDYIISYEMVNEDFSIIKTRKTIFIRKGKFLLLLLNIKKRNFDYFYENIQNIEIKKWVGYEIEE